MNDFLSREKVGPHERKLSSTPAPLIRAKTWTIGNAHLGGRLLTQIHQTWHGHLAREKRAIFHEMPQGITGKMPVPHYFAAPLPFKTLTILIAKDTTICH
jgi:hypothetical protein